MPSFCESTAIRVLLTDGSGLTARQVATQLSTNGHLVEVLSPDPLALTRSPVMSTKSTGYRRSGPILSLLARRSLTVYRSGGFDLLFPTQEQVAVLSASAQHSSTKAWQPPSRPSAPWCECRTSSQPEPR